MLVTGLCDDGGEARSEETEMTPPSSESRFDPSLIESIDHRIRPLKRLLSPVSIGTENIPREGAVLLTGNHTVYGLIDIPMLGLEIYEKTGRVVRGLADHVHFEIPVWRDVLKSVGAVRGTREICARLFEAGEPVMVFPGGGREVMKRKNERYKLIWKERIGFARLAIQYGVPIVPFASVGVEEMFEIVADAEDLLRSPVGDLLRVLGITKQPWFRHGEIIPPLSRGRGPGSIPRIERQYFCFGEPISTQRWAGRHEDREACMELRNTVKTAIERQIHDLREVRGSDPERYPVQRLLRKLSSRLR